MSAPEVEELVGRVERELLPGLELESVDPHHPVVPRRVPAPWRLLGCGNYAAVLVHPEHPERVVKVYAPDRGGLEAEAEVYRRLGDHPAYSRCYHVGDRYLILKRLRGTTLWDAAHRGIAVPDRVIGDVDEALDFARERGLNPHDVHGRNVMMRDGHGLVVDVSDFLKEGECTRWRDLKRAYFLVYRPLLRPLRVRVPLGVLNAVRRGHRKLRGRH